MSLGKYGDTQASNVEKLSAIWHTKRLGEKALKDFDVKGVQSIKNCCNVCANIEKDDEISSSVVIQKKGDSMSYNGVQYCKKVWGCCLCSSLVGAVRALEIRKAIFDWCGGGHSCLMVTLTCRHDSKMNLDFILMNLKTARKRFFENGTVKRLFNKIALGRVWVLELTDGIMNGWNVHTHNLYFCFEKVKYDLKDEIYINWKKCLNSVGLDCDYEHGVDLLSTLDVSKYLTKFSSEISLGQVTKKGRYSRFAPFQLLNQWEKGDEWALMEYRNYYLNTYGLKMLTWQRGLKKFFGLVEEEEIEKYILKKENLFALNRKDFVNLDERKKGFLLSNASLDEKIDYLYELGIDPYFIDKYDLVEEIIENKFMKN